ncbi:MAG: methyltransferase domain-containing protein [Phycisphaerae bacterium]|jgi:ubiquinone/menaquinone biosynthesis C-methylase UbiE
MAAKLPDNFYEKIKPRLYQRIGRDLRLAYRVFDLGCGACGLVRYLSETYNQRVVGVDISTSSFPKKRNITKNTGSICYVRKNAAKLDFVKSKTTDAVVILWALHEMKNPQAVLREAHRVLRPGGKLLVVEFPRNSLAQKLWNENYYTSKKLADSFRKAGFEDIRAKLIEHKQVLWISAHRGSN